MNTGTLLQIATNLDLSRLKFAGGDGNTNPLFLIVLGVIIGSVILTALYLTFTRGFRLRGAARKREELRLRLLLSEASMTEKDRQLLAMIGGGNKASDLIPLLSTRSVFEDAIERYRNEYPGDPALKRIPQLRQQLGYGFANLRNAFTNTRMMSAGTRLTASIPHPKRNLQFVTTILGTSEDALLIRPPTSRGKPLNIRSLKTLNLRVAREDDAEYHFDSKILGQGQDAMRAVAIMHTSKIRKLLYRAAPRVNVEIHFKVFVISQKVVEQHKHRALKREQSQYSLNGCMLDISLGGSRIILPNAPLKPAEGDIIVFQFPQAQIKHDLVSEILDVVETKNGIPQIHLRFVALKELDRLKLSKFIQNHQKHIEMLKEPKVSPSKAVAQESAS